MEHFRLSFSTGDGSFLPIFIGLLIIAFGGFLLWRQWRFVRASTSTLGTVIDYKVTETQERNDNGDLVTTRSFAPIISYTAPDGTSRTFTNRMGTYKKVHEVGKVLRIRYTQHDNEASIDSFVSLYLGPLLVMLLGLVFVVGAFL